jgi:hypothetical protein
MIISDAIVGPYDMMYLVWACYLAIGLASSIWLRRPTFFKGAALTGLSSVFFFVVTNFGTWATSGMYAHTWSGLADCFYMALPFFRNTAVSDMVFTGALFGAYVLMKAAAVSRLSPADQKSS